eukprot:gene23365-35793_t
MRAALFALLVVCQCCAAQTKEELAALAAKTVVASFENITDFAAWNYDGGVIQLGLWEMLGVVDTATAQYIQPAIIAKLQQYTKEGTGAAILQNQTLNFGGAVGDTVSEYPAAYNKLLMQQGFNQDAYNMVHYMADRVKEWPYHLNTGLVSRQTTWRAVGMHDEQGRGIWADDGFMGTAVLDASNVTGHVMEAWKQLTLLHSALNDPTDNLYRHGAFANSSVPFQSCCKWGRANGWTVMAKKDTLSAMRAQNITGQEYDELLGYFTGHLEALLVHVDTNSGLLHNIVNMTQTPFEVSAAGMTLYSLCSAMTEGIIPRGPAFESVADTLFMGVASHIQANGTITGIIGGTGIQDSWQDYGEPGPYDKSGPGLGGALRGMAAYLRLKASS